MQLIAPDEFKLIPWKNGKGVTTELTISPDSTLDNFRWRLSIATVSENGSFSNFSGIWRNLILIEGNGLQLTHDNKTVHQLEQKLDYASFDGASDTIAQLHNGMIKDFNVMHDPNFFDVEIVTMRKQSTQLIKGYDFCFVYSLMNPVKIELVDIPGNATQIPESNLISSPATHLIKLDRKNSSKFNVVGSEIIIVKFTQISH